MFNASKNKAAVWIVQAGCLLVAAGCAPSFQGIKYRAQAPSIEEAFRTVSLAVKVDGYPIDAVDPAAFTLESGWRETKKAELPPADTLGTDALPEARISLKMARRGSLYDVMVTPWLRMRAHGKEEVIVAPPMHPLRTKWEKAVTRLIERESRDED
jgi:hypothetical protein